MDQFEISHSEGKESQGVAVCDNKMFVEIGVVALEGSNGYVVAKVNCPRLPFYGDMVLDQMLHVVKKSKEDLGREVADRLVSFAQELGLKVEPVPLVNFDPELTPKEDTKYNSNKFFNLYVDLGSTNAKCLITECDEQGMNLKLDTIPKMVATSYLCSKWGMRYDKKLAYTYNKEDFNEWLCAAVLTFVRRVQNDRKEYAVNVVWAFPRFEDCGGKQFKVDFGETSRAVTSRLKEYGLRGQFVLMPEAMALESMFRNRAIRIAKASAEEVRLNEDEFSAAVKTNRAEREKEERQEKLIAAAKRKYDSEMQQWRSEHSGFWGTIRGFFSAEPKQEVIFNYRAKFVEEVKDRLCALRDFRNIGVDSEMPFGMLFLDAGGSTLDYCYIPEGARQEVKSGSYLAGGRQVTEEFMKIMGIEDFDDAEDRKKNFARAINPKLMKATYAVYEDCLRDLSSVVKGHGPYLCVVCTGLAMKNVNLRKMVQERLFLAEDQRMIWSEDLAKIPESVVAKHSDLKEFQMIVRRLQSQEQGEPAYDVIGGLYFASKEGSGK